jgi:hypothetical protein
MIGPQFPDEAPAEATDRTLRQFAGLCLVIGAVVFAGSRYRHHGEATGSAWVILVLSLAVGLSGLTYPASIRPVFLGAIALTRPIGHVISTVLLGLIYYGLITPLGLLFRIAGRDPLGRHGPAAESYWLPKVQPTDVRRYLRQYQSQRTTHPGADHGSARKPQ